MAWNAFRFDQEAACDARVLAGADVDTRHKYGRALARAASSDHMPTLAMAMANNSARSIIERLRRLMMKDTSKKRLFAGRAAIFAAAAITLPLTATVVPVFAEEKAPEETEAKVVKKTSKVILIKDKDGKTTKVDISGDDDTPFVKTIEKDGKIIVLRSKRELSEADVEKMVAEAEKSRAEAEAKWGDSEDLRAIAEDARGQAEGARVHAMKVVSSMDFASFIPEIDISEIRANCKKGEPVTTDVQGFDGQNKSRVKVVMCGKGQAKLARMEALKGLREAQSEIERDKDIPDNVRKSVLDSLEKQIDRMEDQLSQEDEPDYEA
jgi:hypothetical protein